MSSKFDTIVVKIGQFYDWMELEPDCNYIVDVVEPFLALSTARNSKEAKDRIGFADNEGREYTYKIGDLLKEGAIRVYYHADVKQFDSSLFVPQRREGMLKSLLAIIEMIVPMPQESV